MYSYHTYITLCLACEYGPVVCAEIRWFIIKVHIRRVWRVSEFQLITDKSRGPQRLDDVVNRKQNENFDTHLIWYSYFIIAKHKCIAGTSLDLIVIVIVGQTNIFGLGPVGKHAILITITLIHIFSIPGYAVLCPGCIVRTVGTVTLRNFASVVEVRL